MECVNFIDATSLHFCKLAPQEYQKAMVMLSKANLPTEDISSDVLLYGLYEEGNELVGTAGLEIDGALALLRSVSVSHSRRQKGYGSYLLRGIEAYAKSHGVMQLYLLTTTASGFFQRNGYVIADRSEAPLAIRNTLEFSSLCPSTAFFMRKELVR